LKPGIDVEKVLGGVLSEIQVKLDARRQTGKRTGRLHGSNVSLKCKRCQCDNIKEWILRDKLKLRDSSCEWD
jgi:hypothetical protein